MDSLILLKYTVMGLMPLTLIVLSGSLLSSLKLITHSTIHSISISYSNFFNPLFIFFNLVGSLRIEKIQELWPLLLTPIVMISFGNALSYVHSKLFKRNAFLSSIITCIITFSNIGNLPIVLMKGICSPYGPIQNQKEYCDEVNSYVSLQLLTYAAITWSYGFTLVESDKQKFVKYEESHLLHEKTTIKITTNFSIFRNILKNLCLPAPLACVAGLLVGMIPGVKTLFYNKNSVLYAVVDSFLSISFAGVIIGQMSLGANLVILSRKKIEFSNGFIASIVLFKNFVTPICALGIVYLSWHLKIFGDNLVMAYVVFISFCCPTAFVILIITQTQEYGNRETAWLMFWVYTFAFPGLIFSTYLFFEVIN